MLTGVCFDSPERWVVVKGPPIYCLFSSVLPALLRRPFLCRRHNELLKYLKARLFRVGIGKNDLGAVVVGSKQKLDLHPHTADATNGEIAIDEPAGWCAF